MKKFDPVKVKFTEKTFGTIDVNLPLNCSLNRELPSVGSFPYDAGQFLLHFPHERREVTVAETQANEGSEVLPRDV